MRVIKKLLLGLVGLVVLAAGVGLALPSSAHVERTVTINAPPESVHALINDFHNFNDWSPWAKLDPTVRYSFEGPAAGVGSKMKWQSEDLGVGSQEITSSEPQLIKVLLDFGEHGTAQAFYRLEPESGATKITWGFDTDFGYNILGRYIGLMCDKWVGADYEKGLNSLKTLAESKQRSG